jgi:hypothetical protein
MATGLIILAVQGTATMFGMTVLFILAVPLRLGFRLAGDGENAMAIVQIIFIVPQRLAG